MLNKLSQHLITAHRTLFRNKICLDIMCFALIGLLDAWDFTSFSCIMIPDCPWDKANILIVAWFRTYHPMHDGRQALSG